MSPEPFDPEALVEVMAKAHGFEMTPESRSGAVIHLKIAAEMAARLLTEPFDDRAEPAPVFTP